MTEARTFEDPGQFPPEKSELLLSGAAGIIECVTDVPEPGVERFGTVIVCHPHPLHGGTMHNKVVTILERSFREVGLHTVRFNFRGVGQSEGEHDDGYGETDDLYTVAEWVRKTRPDDELWLAGFSFGSFIAMRAAINLHVGYLVTIAPPADRFPLDELQTPECPWLVIQGDEDEIVSVDAVRTWVEQLDPKPNLLIMEGAGHFFHRRLMDLRGLLKNAVKDRLPPLVRQDQAE